MLLTVDQWIKLNNQTAGKDKLLRLIQYASRFLWYYTEERKNLRDTVIRLKILENILSTSRKLLRFGKSFEVLYGALNTLKLQDKVLQVTLTMSRIYQSFYLLLDHFIWLSGTGLLNFDKKRLNEYSSKFWLGAVAVSLLRDLYEIILLLNRKPFNVKPSSSYPSTFKHHPVTRALYSAVPQTRPVFIFMENHQDICWDTLKNVCDIWIPLNNLGKTTLSPGIIGLLGIISSLAGLVGVVNPLARLVPA